MPRKKRIWLPNYFYHIGNRGNRRDPLFQNYDDFLAFFHILQRLHEKTPFEIASYCLMTNHYHLLLRSQEVPISKLMAFINKRYANYFNTKYDLTGHVFEKRFFDNIIVDGVGMLDVSRYIHLNPVVAGIVKEPESYPWSSYFLYKDTKPEPPCYMNIESVLDFCDGSIQQKRESYCRSLRL
ncbi:transposase [Neobacillus soli]|uniref:transposase n=1 Tax=Neobacillus soli TaxID=220688 RepID=UPI0008270DA0|nr:transposase [Neobacillus soli]